MKGRTVQAHTCAREKGIQCPIPRRFVMWMMLQPSFFAEYTILKNTHCTPGETM